MKNTFVQATGNVEKYFIKIVIGMLVACIILPFIVWFGYELCADNSVGFSADGILGYIAAVISGLMSFFVGCVALYQSKILADAEEERADAARRKEVCPNLQVRVVSCTEGNMKLLFQNVSEQPAVGVYLFDSSVFAVIKGGEEKTVSIAVEDYGDGLAIDWPAKLAFTETGVPERISLVYYDRDKNLIMEEMRYVDDESFESVEKSYM